MNKKRLSTMDPLDSDACWTHVANNYVLALYNMPNIVMIERL